MTKFWLGEENFPRQKVLSKEIFPDKVIAFSKSVVTPWKICTVINCYAKVLNRFPETRFRVCRDLLFTGQNTFPRNFENDWNKDVNLKLSW